MINVSSKTPFWYQHSEREREKEGRWILGITNTCIYLSCCWTIKCAPNNKNQHREYSLVLYCMEIVDFRTLYLLVTWSFLCWYYSMVEEWSVLSLIIPSFQGHVVHFFLVLNLAPLDKDYFKTIVANYLSWLSIILEFHHSEQLMSSKLEIVDYLISLGEKNYNQAHCS